MLQEVDDIDLQEIPSGYLGFTNLVCNMRNLFFYDISWRDVHLEQGKKPMIRPW